MPAALDPRERFSRHIRSCLCVLLLWKISLLRACLAGSMIGPRFQAGGGGGLEVDRLGFWRHARTFRSHSTRQLRHWRTGPSANQNAQSQAITNFCGAVSQSTNEPGQARPQPKPARQPTSLINQARQPARHVISQPDGLPSLFGLR